MQRKEVIAVEASSQETPSSHHITPCQYFSSTQVGSTVQGLEVVDEKDCIMND